MTLRRLSIDEEPLAEEAGVGRRSAVTGNDKALVPGPGKTVKARLAGGCLVAALIVVGVVWATRPVGDERIRHQATMPASGSVVGVRPSWDGAQVVRVAWTDQNGDTRTSSLEVDVTPPYLVGQEIDLVYDPSRPGSALLVADPTWTNDSDYRIDAVLQSSVLFMLALTALVALVMWPSRPSTLFSEELLRPVRTAIRRYLCMPIPFCIAILASAMAVQDLSSNSGNVGGDADLLSLLIAVPVIWLGVRLLRRQRLVRLVTVPDDAVDNNAVISNMRGRRLRMNGSGGGGTDMVTSEPRVKMVALAGQSLGPFYDGQSVRRYGRWPRRGPTLITDRTPETLLIGFGKAQTLWTPKSIGAHDMQYHSEPASNTPDRGTAHS